MTRADAVGTSATVAFLLSRKRVHVCFVVVWGEGCVSVSTGKGGEAKRVYVFKGGE